MQFQMPSFSNYHSCWEAFLCPLVKLPKNANMDLQFTKLLLVDYYSNCISGV